MTDLPLSADITCRDEAVLECSVPASNRGEACLVDVEGVPVFVAAGLAADPPRVDAAGPDSAAAEVPENPPVGAGLGALAEWSTQWPFIDLMKTARPWTGHLHGQWGGWEHADLEAGGWLDAQGWPTAIPPELSSVEAIFIVDQPPEAVSLAGRYRVSWRGEGRIELFGGSENVRYRPGEAWFDYTPREGLVSVRIVATDPRGVGDHIRDIRIVKAENIELLEAGAIFNPAWLARIENLRALRFMDWMRTNHSTAAEWSGRPRVDDYTYAWRGAPVEMMVALANEIAADPWFNMPHMATDEYFEQFAAYVRDHLETRRKVYVEYSNEVWNWSFGQASWLRDQARARWRREGGDEWIQFAGMRAAEMAHVWDAAFGAQASNRLVKVISTQTGWLGLEKGLLDAPLWVAEDPARNAPPSESFDAYGVTGYFSGLLGNEKAADVRAWLDESLAAAEASAERAVSLARRARPTSWPIVSTGRPPMRSPSCGTARGPAATPTSIAGLFEGPLAYQASVAQDAGLDLVMYEGGTHVVGIGPHVDDDLLTDFFRHLNYTPEMGALYCELLARWHDLGGTLFNAYVDVAGPSKWGSWGALRHLDDDNPRWSALAAFNRSTPAWWEQRPKDAFGNGSVRRGTPAADNLAGGAYGDVLLGGHGDDRLAGGGGADRLHGGEGQDTAVLPGRWADYRLEVEGGALLAIAGSVVRLVSIEILAFEGEPGRLSRKSREMSLFSGS